MAVIHECVSQSDEARCSIASQSGALMTATNSQPKSFLTDIQAIRQRARSHLMDGAITPAYKADREKVIAVLNEALATEIICVLRYTAHYYLASGIHANAVKAEFLEHAADEQGHANKIAERITQLNGEPNFSPEGLMTRSHSEFIQGETLVDMIKEDLVAERIAVDTYREIVQFLGNDDPTSRAMMEEILASEEEHAEDLKTMLENLGEKGEPAQA
jgi:bacterioferritin